MNYTSRSDFPENLPIEKVFYCWNCKYPGAKKNGEKDPTGQEKYYCSNCKILSDRVLIFDPQMMYKFDDQERLVHYGSGIIILNKQQEILLFLRRKFPFLYTIPAGHMVFGEDPRECAIREVEEEVNIKVKNADLIFDDFIEGDECQGGADIHHWHLYKSDDYEGEIKLDEEGSGWKWQKIEDIDLESLTFPVKHFLTNKEVLKKIFTKLIV